MGFEPTAPCLGSKHSSAELHPHVKSLTEYIYLFFSFENLYKHFGNWWYGLSQSWQPPVWKTNPPFYMSLLTSRLNVWSALFLNYPPLAHSTIFSGNLVPFCWYYSPPQYSLCQHRCLCRDYRALLGTHHSLSLSIDGRLWSGSRPGGCLYQSSYCLSWGLGWYPSWVAKERYYPGEARAERIFKRGEGVTNHVNECRDLTIDILMGII